MKVVLITLIKGKLELFDYDSTRIVGFTGTVVFFFFSRGADKTILHHLQLQYSTLCIEMIL